MRTTTLHNWFGLTYDRTSTTLELGFSSDGLYSEYLHDNSLFEGNLIFAVYRFIVFLYSIQANRLYRTRHRLDLWCIAA